VEVGLRTAVWFPSKESVKGKDDLIADMNEIIRDVSIQVNCSLYDYDRDVWSLFDFQHTSESNHNKIFREKGSVDPIARYSASAAEKMLGRQYSAAYWGRGAAAGLYAVNTSSSEVFGEMVVRLVRVKSASEPEPASAPLPAKGTPAVVATDDLVDGSNPDGPSEPADPGRGGVKVSAEEIQQDQQFDLLLAAARAAVTRNGSAPSRRLRVRRTTDEDFQLYLLEYGPDRRHQVRRWAVGGSGASLRQLLRCIHVGPLDVLDATDGQLAAVPLAGTLPHLLGDANYGQLAASILLAPASQRVCVLFGGSCDDLEVLGPEAVHPFAQLPFHKMPTQVPYFHLTASITPICVYSFTGYSYCPMHCIRALVTLIL